MAGKQQQQQEPVTDPEAAPSPVDVIRLVMKPHEVSTVANGKLTKNSGVAVELFLPAPGQRGVRSADETFFGNNVGEVLTFLASWAEDRTIAQFGDQIRANATNGGA